MKSESKEKRFNNPWAELERQAEIEARKPKKEPSFWDLYGCFITLCLLCVLAAVTTLCFCDVVRQIDQTERYCAPIQDYAQRQICKENMMRKLRMFRDYDFGKTQEN